MMSRTNGRVNRRVLPAHIGCDGSRRVRVGAVGKRRQSRLESERGDRFKPLPQGVDQRSN